MQSLMALIAVGFLRGGARLGGNGECGQGVGVRRVEHGHILRKVLRQTEFGVAISRAPRNF